MRNIILLLIFIINSSIYCGEIEKISNYTDFYTTFGFFSDKFKEYVPSISIGKRSISDKGNGVDFGITGGYLERDDSSDDYVLMFPKVEYIHYGTKNLNGVNGFVGIGGGSAFYHLKEGEFNGIVGNATIGIDFFRDKNLSGFIQTKVYYPLLSFVADKKTEFPLMQFDLGLGF